MLRRIWPYALALVAVAVFGSYLAYTRYLFEQTKRRPMVFPVVVEV